MVKRALKGGCTLHFIQFCQVTQSTTGTEVFAAPTFKRGRVSVNKTSAGHDWSIEVGTDRPSGPITDTRSPSRSRVVEGS